jgi:hypothetical protein
MKNIDQEIAAARKKLDDVSNELKALEQRAKEQEGPWVPPAGDWIACVVVGTAEGPSARTWQMAGVEYPTRESAESALPYLRFFTRLVRLAADVNPSGKPGWNYCVYRGTDGRWTYSSLGVGYRDPWHLFETEEAAQKAADIMNRDGWEVPWATTTVALEGLL